MIPLSPALFIACACGRLSGRTSFACRFDHDHRRDSLGLPAAHDEAAAMRFINGVGFWAHFDHRTGRSSWPIPELATANELAHFGLEYGILCNEPEIGDLVVVRNPRWKRYSDVQVVVSVLYVDETWGAGAVQCATLHAHCRGAVARPQWFELARGDRFLRWVDLDQRDWFGMPLREAA